MRVQIKHSKADPFIGVNIIIGCTGGPLCPVAAVLAYLAVRKGGEGPLFRFNNGNALTCEWFVTNVREVLQQVGID